MENKNSLLAYTLRIADDSLILGQRLSEWCGHGPVLEEDIALTNIALDFVGQATNLYEYAAVVANDGRTSDDFAFLRLEHEYTNVLLVEQPNGHFGDTIARQFLFDAFRKLFYEQLTHSKDEHLSAIAAKSLMETKYHVKHSSEWLIRLGDGTELSHGRVQESIDDLWKFADELFYMDEIDRELIEKGIAFDLEALRQPWMEYVDMVLDLAKLEKPSSKWIFNLGRKGAHSEHMGYILTEMQYMQRAYPGMEW